MSISEMCRGAANELKHNLDFGPIAKRRADRARWQIAQTGIGEYIHRGGLYLDIGCGKGYIRRAIEQSLPGVTVFGCDIEDYPTRKMKQQTSETFAFSDGGKLPYPENSFDGIMLFFVLHHVPKEQQILILSEAVRVVKDGGLIFIAEDTVDIGDARQRQITEQADRKFNPDFGLKLPHTFRSPEEWLEMFDSMNLKVKAEKPYQTGKVPHTFFVLEKMPELNQKATD